jgi:hypothetical protein
LRVFDCADLIARLSLNNKGKRDEAATKNQNFTAEGRRDTQEKQRRGMDFSSRRRAFFKGTPPFGLRTGLRQRGNGLIFRLPST